MAMDIQKIVSQIEDAQKSAYSLIEVLTKVAKDADSFGGKVSQIIPGNVQKDIELITTIANGTEQHSLNQLIQALKSLTLGDILPTNVTTTTLNIDNNAPAAPVGTGSPVDQIDTTPDTNAGAQSAIVNDEAMAARQESSLSAYLKQGRMKEQQAKYVANTINLGKTLEGIQDDSPYGRSMNEMVSPDLHYNLNKVLEGNSNAMAIGANFDNSLQSSMRRVAANKANYQKMHEGEAPAEVPSWRKAALTVHMNESHNDFDGMFGGAAPKPIADRGALIENMSFDDIFAGGVADGSNSVHIVDNAYNK